MSHFSDQQIANADAHTADDDWYDLVDYHMAQSSRPAPVGSAIPDWRPYEPVAPLSDADLLEVIDAAAALYAPPVACVWCSSTAHPASKCPVAAAMTGQPLLAGLRTEIENLKAANIALQYEVIHQAEIAGYTYELLNSLLRGTIKLSTGRAAIKKAMARLCPGALS